MFINTITYIKMKEMANLKLSKPKKRNYFTYIFTIVIKIK